MFYLIFLHGLQDFCQLWQATWNLPAGQGVDNTVLESN